MTTFTFKKKKKKQGGNKRSQYLGLCLTESMESVYLSTGFYSILKGKDWDAASFSYDEEHQAIMMEKNENGYSIGKNRTVPIGFKDTDMKTGRYHVYDITDEDQIVLIHIDEISEYEDQGIFGESKGKELDTFELSKGNSRASWQGKI